MLIERTLDDVKGLVRVAAGEDPPDLAIVGGRILDVFNGALFDGDVWVYKHWIAYVGSRKTPADERTRVVDARGLVVIPGFIDAHGHADLFYNPASFSDAVITGGTTTVFSDGHDMINSIGIEGFIEVLKSGDIFNIKYLWGVPATYPPYPEVEGGEMFSIEDVRKLLSGYGRCVSLSELSSYMRVLKNDEGILERIQMARSMGKNVEGHTLGASYDRLNVLAAAGITSCHESIGGQDLQNRSRLGLYTMVRHSSIRSDLMSLCPVMKGMPKDSLMLVSDGIFAADLCAKGYMDYVVSEAVRFGLEPVDAIRMATLNPARYFRIDGEIGSVAPGRIADCLIVEDLNRPVPAKVIERGILAAENGSLLRGKSIFPDVGIRHNPFVFSHIDEEEFLIKKKDAAPVPVIDIVDRTVTKRSDVHLPEKDGHLLPDRAADIRKAFCSRRDKKSWGRGFVRGIGAAVGAIAMTVSHETHGLLVTGFDDGDMKLAAEAVIDMGGGVVVVDKGKIIHSLSLPQGGTMSNLGVPELALELQKIKTLLREKGSALDDPLWTIGFLTFTSIVELRLTVSGVYDVKKAAIIF